MDQYLSVDEIIDKNAYKVKIFKQIEEHNPEFIVSFEKFAIGMSDNHPAIWWTEMTPTVMRGTVYVFQSNEHFEKFKKTNYNFINKINFIL